MDTNELIHGLQLFVGFLAFVTLHEFAHAWTAERCGDDTPRLQGRVTLDPLAHIDPLGTILVPLVLTVWGAMGGNVMMFGWGRPVEVNLGNFRNRRLDDILVSGAGPAMNMLIAILLLCVMKVVELTTDNDALLNPILHLAEFNVFLCFFNLLPVPPLDGGHIMRNLVGMTEEAYRVMSQYSFLFLMIIMNARPVGVFVSRITGSTLAFLARPFGWELS